MNQKELETALSAKCNITKAEADQVVNALLEILEENLQEPGDKVVLRNIGTLHIAEAAPTQRYSPYHKKFVDVPAKKHLRLRPSEKFEGKINLR